jgi:aminoglycoside/choline kinase family phosphotransferase
MRAATQNKGYLLTMLPRVLGYLYNDLNHPLLFNLKKWFDEAIPRQQVVTGRTYGGLTKIWLEN